MANKSGRRRNRSVRKSPSRSKMKPAGRPSRVLRKYKAFKPKAFAVEDHDGPTKHTYTSHKEPTKHASDSHKAVGNDRQEKNKDEVKTVPNPIPDTRITSAVQSTLARTDEHTITSTFPTLSSSKSVYSSSPIHSITVSSTPTTTVNHQQADSAQTSKALHTSKANSFILSPLVIALVAVGSACMIIAAFLIFRARSRPRRRNFPVPSAPILNEDYYGDEKGSAFGSNSHDSESPIFGGNERFSSHAGKNWNWTQYPQATTHSIQATGMDRPVLISLPPLPSHNEGLNRDTPQNQPIEHIAKPSRFSAVSASIYPTSPQLAAYPSEPVPGKSYTGDGQQIMKRSSRGNLRRSKSYADDASMHRRQSSELAYAGADVSSPNFIAQFPDSHTPMPAGGRTRIKSSYYAPGSYPRMSSVPSSLKASGDVSNYTAPPLPKSESRTDRDTKALAAAMGLSSPTLDYMHMPASPQPTLYPDDSLSVVNVRRPSKKKSVKKPVPEILSPTIDTSFALGSLMMMDFGATNKSLASLASQFGDDGSTSKGKAISDKPPRVPSPPPLPSLTQMSLEQGNPGAYANYHSPTYSIYGLYEADRKSRASGTFR